jgi:peptidoglycan/xylan/chitin deacetylase (PgdA/CDA1 family)
MKKIFIFLILVFNIEKVFANNIEYSQFVNQVLNDYSQELVKEFDEKIKNGLSGLELFKTDTYAKLQVIYHNNFNKNNRAPSSFEAEQFKEALEVRNFVDNLAQDWLTNFNELVYENNVLKKIEPSTQKNGNLTGLEFSEGMWALTFDDGPNNTTTLEVLDNLKQLDLKATFFELTTNIISNLNVTKKQKKLGMEVENHSYTHPVLTKLGQKSLEKEIISSSEKMESLLGERPKFFRCPYGAGVSTQRVRQMIASQNMIHVFWTVDTLDWQDKNPESIFNRALNQMKQLKRGIILFHDIHPQSVIASKMLMEYLKKEQQAGKAKIVLIDEAVQELNRNRN